MPTIQEVRLQNASNHARRDIAYLTTALVLFINVLVTLYLLIGHAIHHGTHRLPANLWIFVVSTALLVLALSSRSRDLRVQDRLIRLEERLRYAALLTPAALAASTILTLPQVIALRFASDAELPTLITRSTAENLTPKQIKAAITTWRPDNHRA